MICTVSTVKDSLPNVTRFVSGNLSSGSDHMFIFLEGRDPDVLHYLRGHEHVTVIDTEAGHWGPYRPRSLNRRQVLNANLVNCALSQLRSAEWLFHLDGDECLEIDVDGLRALTSEVSQVRLRPKEAVSPRSDEGGDRFKRLLDKDELALLHLLGVLDRPANGSYFRGHVAGKPGIRPSLDVGLHVHDAKPLEGEPTPPFRADWLSMLHYDSVTPSEFVRKWTALNTAGSRTHFRQPRDVVRRAAAAVAENSSLDDCQREEYLVQLYERAVKDDVCTLSALGYLEGVRPEWHRHRPRQWPEEDRTRLDMLMPELLSADKAYFRPANTEWHPAELMVGLAGSTSVPRPGVRSPRSRTARRHPHRTHEYVPRDRG